MYNYEVSLKKYKDLNSKHGLSFCKALKSALTHTACDGFK